VHARPQNGDKGEKGEGKMTMKSTPVAMMQLVGLCVTFGPPRLVGYGEWVWLRETSQLEIKYRLGVVPSLAIVTCQCSMGSGLAPPQHPITRVASSEQTTNLRLCARVCSALSSLPWHQLPGQAPVWSRAAQTNAVVDLVLSMFFNPNIGVSTRTFLLCTHSIHRQAHFSVAMARKFPEVQPGGSLILAWQIKDKKVLVVGGGEVCCHMQTLSRSTTCNPSSSDQTLQSR
jgi:hypothetical protein